MSNSDEVDAPQTPSQLGVKTSVSEPPDARGDHQSQPDPDEVIIGQALSLLRTLRGLTQRQLATLVGTTNGMISQLENGRQSPKFITVQSLLRAMRFSLTELEWAQQMIVNPDVERSLPRRPREVALILDLAPVAEGIGKAVTDWLLSFPPDAVANLKARRGRRRPAPRPRARAETGRIDGRTKAGRALRDDPRTAPSQVTDPWSL